MKIIKLCNSFYKYSQQLPPKEEVEKRDRFGGVTGDERQNLLENEVKSKGFTLVKKTKTPINANDCMNILINIFNEKYPDLNDEQKKEFALTMVPQIKIETGFYPWNYNIASIHATKSSDFNKYWKGKVYASDDPQYDKSGKKYINVDWLWRAYDNLNDGIGDWFLFIEKRFPNAIQYAINGDIEGYAKELGHLGYYTASVKSYVDGMKKSQEKIKEKLI